MTQRGRNILNNAAAVLFWIAVWQLLSLLVGKPLLLPGPWAVLRRLGELLVTADFWRQTLTSLLRVLGGIVSGAALGVLLAALTCRSRAADALLSPLLTVIKSTPVASFTILVLLWIDRDGVPVFISALMVLPVVWANVCAGIRGTDGLLLEMARVYRLPPAKVLTRIYVPSVLPHFRAACRAALGFGWKAGIAAEVLTVPRAAIGRMIYESKLYLETTDLFAWTLAVILLSLALEKGLMRLIAGRQTDG